MAERRRRDNLLPIDAHDGPMPMDFFVWLLRSPARAVLVDTGFSRATARVRDRERVWQRCPIDALAKLDVAPDAIDDVVITHLHYDHAGNLDKLPRRRRHRDAPSPTAGPKARQWCPAPCAAAVVPSSA